MLPLLVLAVQAHDASVQHRQRESIPLGGLLLGLSAQCQSGSLGLGQPPRRWGCSAQLPFIGARNHDGRERTQRRPRQVTRYLLPQLQAMNIVLDDVLDGGVNDSLNLDSHGKALSYLLLDMPVTVPAHLSPHFGGPTA